MASHTSPITNREITPGEVEIAIRVMAVNNELVEGVLGTAERPVLYTNLTHFLNTLLLKWHEAKKGILLVGVEFIRERIEELVTPQSLKKACEGRCSFAYVPSEHRGNRGDLILLCRDDNHLYFALGVDYCYNARDLH